MQKGYANTDQTYPRLRGSADTLTLSRINLTDRVTLLAKGFGDTPLDANQLASGTVPGARLPANVQLKPVAESDVTNLVTDLAAKAPLASPALTGVPTAPTAAPGTTTPQLATTAFVTAGDAANVPIFGTFVPAVGGTATYSEQTGNYVKTGRLVCIQIRLLIDTIGSGSPAQISGLPFPVFGYNSLTVGLYLGLATPVVNLGAYVTGSSIHLVGAAGAAANQTNDIPVIGNGTILFIGGTYLTP